MQTATYKSLGNEPPVVASSGVSFTVNGEQKSLELDTSTTLFDTLREHLNLTGTKKGCDHGQCGACTVLVNGRRINPYLSLAMQHEVYADIHWRHWS